MTLPSTATSSTVNAVRVPTLVMFAWAAVARVPAIVPPETFIPALKTGMAAKVATPVWVRVPATVRPAAPTSFKSSADSSQSKCEPDVAPKNLTS